MNLKKYLSDETDTLEIEISIEMLDKIISYLFTFSKFITNRHLTNIREFFKTISISLYRADIQSLIRVHLIRNVVKCRLDYNMSDYFMIIEDLRNQKGKYLEDYEEFIFPTIENEDVSLTKDDIKFVNNFVYERLRYNYLYKCKDYIIELLDQIDVNTFDSIKESHDNLINTMQLVVSQAKKAKVDDEDNKQFSLSDDDFNTTIKDLIKEIKQPTNYLKTGIQYLNDMLNGGFEAGRCTLILGSAKSYKSGLLLSIAHWIKKYNKDYIPRDKNKIPCVLYLTQENSLKETLERL